MHVTCTRNLLLWLHKDQSLKWLLQKVPTQLTQLHTYTTPMQHGTGCTCELLGKEIFATHTHTHTHTHYC